MFSASQTLTKTDNSSLELFLSRVKNRFAKLNLVILEHVKINNALNKDINLKDFSFTVQCSEGHAFHVSGNTLRKGACYCRKCHSEPPTSKRSLSVQTIYDLRFKSHNLKLVDSEFDINTTIFEKNSFTMVCEHGHTFSRSGNSLRKGNWNCPTCSKHFVGEGGSMEEEYVRLMLQEHFNKKFNNVRPDWLINSETNSTLELDMFCEELNLAFEYNGPTHYLPLFGEDNLLQTQKRDRIKSEVCAKNNITLFTIKHESSYSSTLGFLKKIAEQLKTFDIEISQEIISNVSKISLLKKENIETDEIFNATTEFTKQAQMLQHSFVGLMFNDQLEIIGFISNNNGTLIKNLIN